MSNICSTCGYKRTRYENKEHCINCAHKKRSKKLLSSIEISIDDDIDLGKCLLIENKNDLDFVYIYNPKEEIPKIIECLQRFQKELK